MGGGYLIVALFFLCCSLSCILNNDDALLYNWCSVMIVIGLIFLDELIVDI